MKVLYLNLEANRRGDHWLTINREYLVLSILMTLKGPAKFRILSDDNRTPILVDTTMFSGSSQSLPRTWVATIREGGSLELGPRLWLELSFWDRYFDGDADAVATFQNEVQAMMDMTPPSG